MSEQAQSGGRMGWVDAARGAAILAVLAIHVSGHTMSASPAASRVWLMLAVANQALQWAVPAFLMLAAFLGSRAYLRGEAAVPLVQKRVARVLWPYAVWTAVYLLLTYRANLQDLNAPVLARALLTGKGYYHLYFMVALLQMHLLLPFVAAAFRRRPPFWLAALGAVVLQGGIYVANARALHLSANGSTALWYVPGIVLGVWLASQWDRLETVFRRGWPGALAVTVGALAVFMPLGLASLQNRPLNTTTYEASLWAYTAGAAFLLMAAAHAFGGRARTLQAIGARSLPIYLVHPMALPVVDGVVHHLPPLPAWLLATIAFAACLAWPLFLAWLLEQVGLSRWAWGGESRESAAAPPLWKQAAALAAAVLGVALFHASSRAAVQDAFSPPSDAVYTSARQVTGLALGPGGSLWAATGGGVLRGGADGAWTKFTRMDGLPAHAVRGIHAVAGGVAAVVDGGAAVWNGRRWALRPGPLAASTTPVTWQGTAYLATAAGLRRNQGGRWVDVPLPPVPRARVSALLPHGGALWAALFGDGLWAFDGARWKPVEAGLPAAARNITALAGDAGNVWVGTQDSGVWRYTGGQWSQRDETDEPFDGDIRAMAVCRGTLFAATRSNGIVERNAQGWGHDAAPSLSTDAPRDVAAFHDALYALHGNGRVDRWDGTRWMRNVWSWLPRPAVVLAADERRLLVGETGGWSAYDGLHWVHHTLPSGFQRNAVNALCPDGSRVWLSVAGRGLGSADTATGAFQWRAGPGGGAMTGVSALRAAGGRLYAGTRAGQIETWDGARWTAATLCAGFPVRALAPDGGGGVVAAGRGGLWRCGQGGAQSLHARAPFLDADPQALCATPHGLWVGSPTTLAFLRRP